MTKLTKTTAASILIVASMITVFAAWCAWENWGGAREWGKTRARLISENVALDFRELIPEMPPVDQNFTQTPLLASLTDYTWKRHPAEISEEGEILYTHPELRNRFLEIRLPGTDKEFSLPDWSTARKMDLGEAPDISELLAGFSKELAEIDAAARRPYAQLPAHVGDDFIDNISMPLPFLNDLMKFQKFEMLRGCRALEAGDTEQALTAIRVLIQLSRAAASHPTLLGCLVGQSHLSGAISLIWQGMATESWTDAELVSIQSDLANLDLLDNLERALNFEMVIMQIGSADFIKALSLGDSEQIGKLVEMSGESNRALPAMSRFTFLIPSGIWDHNKALGARIMLDYGILPVRNRTLPDKFGFEQAVMKRSLHNLLVGIILPATSTFIEKGFNSRVAIDLAGTACAVERYRLKNGEYPDTLQTLAPDFLEKVPRDLMAPRQTLKYEKGLRGDRYLLYSLGLNGSDDGGAIALGKSNHSRQDLSEGDWVWRYAP